MFPLPLGRGRVRVGVAPLATSAVYHRQDAPFLTFPPAGRKGHGGSGRASHPPRPTRHAAPHPSFRRTPESTPPPALGISMFPLPLGRGRVSVGVAPLATSAVYHRQDAPFLTFPPAGEGTRRLGKGAPPTTPPPVMPPPPTRLSGESRNPRRPHRNPAPRSGRQPTQSQKSPKSNESQFKTKPPPRLRGNGRQQPQEPLLGWR